MKALLTLFAATVLCATSCRRDDGVIVEQKESFARNQDTLTINDHVFISDKMLGDYYINTRDNGDIVIRTRAYERRAKDHLPLGFDFTHDGKRIASDTIGHRTADILRYVGMK